VDEIIWIKNTDDWIKNLKVGDKVFQVERNKLIPTGFWKWKGVVTKIESNFIEVKYCREPVDWLEDLRVKMKKNSNSNIDSTYNDNWIKNYFAPDGTINIEQIK
jgi:hypothetical protein